MEYHGDDTPLIFHDTLLSSLIILLVHISKFNVHDTSITLLRDWPYRFIVHPDFKGKRQKRLRKEGSSRTARTLSDELPDAGSAVDREQPSSRSTTARG